jgi:hypothetical protein
MKKYLVSLVRDYGIVIKAKNEEEAMRCAEFFVGGEKDLSQKKDREEYKFRIETIEMTNNDAIDVEEYKAF